MALFGKTTVDTIVADLNAKGEALEALADAERSAAYDKRQQAAALVLEAEAGEAEALRAVNIADKIEELVS